MYKIPYLYQKIDQFATSDSIKTNYEQLLQQGKVNHFSPFLFDEIHFSHLLSPPCHIEYGSVDLAITMQYHFKECKEYVDESMIFDDFLGHKKCEQDQDDFFYLQGEPSDLMILKLPTSSPWEIPLYFSFDHWNKAEQICLFQHWYTEYQAYPAYATENSWSFYVEAPPRSLTQANQLFQEHLAFSGIEMLASVCPRDYIADLQTKKIWTLFY